MGNSFHICSNIQLITLQALDFAPHSVPLWVSYLGLMVNSSETPGLQDSEEGWEETEAQFVRAVTTVGHQHDSADLWDIIIKYSKNKDSLRAGVEQDYLEPFIMESGSIMWSAAVSSLKRQDTLVSKLEETFQRWRLAEWQRPEFWQEYLPWLRAHGSVNKVAFHENYS